MDEVVRPDLEEQIGRLLERFRIQLERLMAIPAAHTKRTYTQAQFLRLKARRGPMKAVVAVAATIPEGVLVRVGLEKAQRKARLDWSHLWSFGPGFPVSIAASAIGARRLV